MGNAFKLKFLKSFFVVALPMILQQALGAAVQLVDNFMVGSLGGNAISAVASVNQLFFIGMLIVFGITGGAGIYTAQYYGDKDFDKLKQSYRLKIVCSIVIVSIILVISLVFRESLVGLFLDKGTETFDMAMSYIIVSAFGLVPMAINASIGSTFRETARPIYPTISATISILLNTFLNWILIFGNLGMPALGVQGAAIATLTARTVETFIMLLLVKLHGSEFSTKVVNLFKIDKGLARNIFKKAIPLTMNEFLWSTGTSVLYFSYALRPDNQLAGHSIAYTVFQLAFIIFGGVGVAVSVLVGNELGANNIEKAKENSRNILVLGAVMAMIAGATVYGLSDLILSLYNIDQVAYSIAKSNLGTLAMVFPVVLLNVGIFFSMRAGGDTKSTLLMDAVFTWVVPVPIALMLGYLTNMSVSEMFLIVNIMEVLKLVIALHRYKKGYWLNNLTTA